MPRLSTKGKTYGLRVHEFRRFIELPKHCPASRFEMAAQDHSGDAKDIAILRVTPGRWLIRKSSPGPTEYRSFSRRGSEFMIPKHMYVESQAACLSDRSVYYLATGRPVLAATRALRGFVLWAKGC
jgi:hypothetical protein